ncbi:MAG TPA: hypothetical protein VF951_12230, partial [Streptosporangiaceae bacterium]
GPEVADERYWHPEHHIDDLPSTRYGFPAVSGVLTAARHPFRAAGLGLPWYAVHGNHDNMLQGTVPAAGWLASLPVGAVKYVSPAADLDAAGALYWFDAAGAAGRTRRQREHPGYARSWSRARHQRHSCARALPYHGHPDRPRLRPSGT